MSRDQSSLERPVGRLSADRSPAGCALRAQLRGEQLLGTAFPAARLLLVEQPGPWGRDGLRTSRFDPDVATALERRARAEGLRLQAIRRPGRSPSGVERRWAVVDCRDGQESLRWGTFGADAELLELAWDASSGPADHEPLYLVCTHGKHDACCASRGRPVAAAIERARPGRVFESSHLGGHRFAANVLVLPAGLLYGRVLPVAAPEFVAAAEADEVVAPLLRGRVGLVPAAQAALAFAYEHLGLRSRTAVHVVSASAVVDGLATVRLAGPNGLLQITVAVEQVPAAGLSCADPGADHYLRHRPVRIEAVA